MTAVYLSAATAGLAWAALSFLLSHAGGHVHGGDAGGHVAHGGHGHDPDAGLPLLSPTVIAAYVAGFGFGGLGAQDILGFSRALFHVPFAIASAGALGLAMAAFLKTFVRGQESTSAVPANAFVGLDAQVTVAIPARGVGEIAFEHNGTRFCGAARALDGDAHPQGESVLVAQVLEDGSYRVERIEPRRRAGPLAASTKIP